MSVRLSVQLRPASTTPDPYLSERIPMATPFLEIKAKFTVFRVHPSQLTVQVGF